MHVHPESPALGEDWERQPVITFDKVKLTNNPLDQNGHVSIAGEWVEKGEFYGEKKRRINQCKLQKGTESRRRGGGGGGHLASWE
jgi:hypothetical protein